MPTPYHRPHRGSGLLSGFASLFGSMPLSVFPPRKSAWEQSGDDIRAVWQDVGGSLRWAMDEYEREEKIQKIQKIQKIGQFMIELEGTKVQITIKIGGTKTQKRGKAEAVVRKEERVCA